MPSEVDEFWPRDGHMMQPGPVRLHHRHFMWWLWEIHILSFLWGGFVSIVSTAGHVHLPLLRRIKSSIRKIRKKTNKYGESERNSGREKEKVGIRIGATGGRERPNPNLIWFTPFFSRNSINFPTPFIFLRLVLVMVVLWCNGESSGLWKQTSLSWDSVIWNSKCPS